MTEESKAIQPVQQNNVSAFGKQGVELRTMDDAWLFASKLIKSGLAPQGIGTPEAALIAIQMGAEVGLAPMAALRSIAVINGRPTMWGDAVLGVCRASGVFDESNFMETVDQDPKTKELVAVCSVCRKGGNPVTREFTMSDAKQAGLLAKKGPWSQYPKRMLQMRARSWALRDAFTDVLQGFMVREEAEDIERTEKQETHAVKVEQLDELTEVLEQKSAEPEVDPRSFELDE